MSRFKYTVSPEVTLGDALRVINDFHHGFTVAVAQSGQLLGTLTDGDIRRAMLGGAALTDLVSPFINKNCTFVKSNATREQKLKHFDQRVRFLPVVDENHCLVDVVTIDDLKYIEAKDLTAKAKAPARVSFGGGGNDLKPIFF